MQRLRFGWLLLAPVLVNAGACGGSSKSNSPPDASGGADHMAGTPSSGGKGSPVAGRASISAGENSGGAAPAGVGGQQGGEAGAADVGWRGERRRSNGGAPSGPEHECGEPRSLAILGDYGEAGGHRAVAARFGQGGDVDARGGR